MFDSKWFIKNKKNKNEDLLSSILSFRNIDDKESFLNPELKDLFDPFLIDDMDKAVKRIKEAIDKNEKIFVYGDYDADGITSTAILIRFFKEINNRTDYFIPDRFDDGYGLNLKSLETLINRGAQLVITTDCGINSLAEADYLFENNVDVIITDHHASFGELPKAAAVLCCTRSDNTYPYSNLSGAGIAYKLTEALRIKLDLDIDAKTLLAIAAIGTVSDVVALDGENRIIVRKGIEAIKERICPCIEAILEVSSVERNNVDSYTLGFVIGPRLNAAGRMGQACSALKLMLEDDYNISRKIAIELDKLNNLRKKEQDRILEKIFSRFHENPELYSTPVIVIEGSDFFKGVLGIVASKISEMFNKPAFILFNSNGILEGSGRSGSDFSMIKSLDYCKDILIKYGGHQNASGLSLKTENLSIFRKKLCEFAISSNLVHDTVNIIEVDSEINAEDINFTMIENIKLLEPYGNGNTEPIFALKNARLCEIRKIGKQGNHMSFIFKLDKCIFKAVCFNTSAYEPLFFTGEYYDILFKANINFFNGSSNIQLMLEDIAFSKNAVSNLSYLIIRILVHMLKYKKGIKDILKIEDLAFYLFKIGMPASAVTLIRERKLYKINRENITEVYNILKTLRINDVFDMRDIFKNEDLTKQFISIEVLVEIDILNLNSLGIYRYRIENIHKGIKRNLRESLIYKIFS